MAHGIISSFDQRKGCGFISRAGFVSRDGAETKVFVDRSQLRDDVARPVNAGDRVTFTLAHGKHGLRAADVHRIQTSTSIS